MFHTEPDNIVFNKPTYFYRRPHVRHIDSGINTAIDNVISDLSSTYADLKDTHLVTLYDVKRYIIDKGIAVQATGKDSAYKQFINTGVWIRTDKPAVITDTNYMSSIYSADNCMTFAHTSINNAVGYATGVITAEKDMMLNVIANLLLTKTYDQLTELAPSPYYNTALNYWLGLIIVNDDNAIVGTTTRFSDILNVYDAHSEINYAIAQVKLTMPIAKNTEFRLFTPAQLNVSSPVVNSITNNDKFKRSLFAGLNAAHIAYFDDNVSVL